MFFMMAAAIGTFCFSSCSQDETISENPANKQAISFTTYSGKAAEMRGTIMDNDVLHTEHFGVTAFYTGTTAWTSWTTVAPNFMYNQEIKYVSSAWEYSPIKYWPTMDNEKVSFFAYAPYATDGDEHGIKLEANTVGKTSLTFTVNDDVDKMVDFVAAVAIDQEQNDQYDGGRSAVNFNLQHELTRLAFTVQLDEDLAEVANTNVVLKKVTLAESDNYYASATYNWSNENGKRGAWINPVKKVGGYDFVTSFNTNKDAGATICGKTYADATLALTTTEKISLLKEPTGKKEYFFLIPVDGGIAEKSTPVTFEYDIVTKDDEVNGGFTCTEATKTVWLPKDIMQQGKAYSVNFTIHVDEIEVEASVEGWDITDEDQGNVDVPFTPDTAE